MTGAGGMPGPGGGTSLVVLMVLVNFFPQSLTN